VVETLMTRWVTPVQRCEGVRLRSRLHVGNHYGHRYKYGYCAEAAFRSNRTEKAGQKTSRLVRAGRYTDVPAPASGRSGRTRALRGDWNFAGMFAEGLGRHLSRRASIGPRLGRLGGQGRWFEKKPAPVAG